VGHTIWVDVEGRAKSDISELSDNSIMLALEKKLDAICKKIGVARLSEFYDHSALQESYADLLEEAGIELEEPTPQWFDPVPALAAVRAIQDHLKQHPEVIGIKANDVSRAHWPKDLTKELKHCRSRLQGAIAKKKRFRFLIVS
jgi:hypothetical protein